MSRSILWHHFSRPIPYSSGLQLQENLHRLQLERRRVNNNHPDILLLLEHRPVYTTGRRQSQAALDDERRRLIQYGAEWVPSNRGGETTYHGPGQLVGYPLFDLRRFEVCLSVKDYVCLLQRTLKSFAELHGVRTVDSEHTGAFVSDTEKLGSIGVQVRHRLTTHGISINITEEPIPWFNEVVACGLPSVNAVSLSGRKGEHITIDQSVSGVLDRVQHLFKVNALPLSDHADAAILELITQAEQQAVLAGPWPSLPLKT
ncbi:lipoyltransferase [Clavulina sp. PMI_390]|nr:lipoyltransferase [Clavulina sp. PMI_390]